MYRKYDRHGHAPDGNSSKTYKCWAAMKHRCSNKNNQQYKDYGGRGIRVCERWEVFKAFLEDMGEKPPNTSIDRIDNDGDYCPENCRWTTRKQQALNRRSNVLLRCYSGPKGVKTLSQWSEITGTDDVTISGRLRIGWTHKEAVFGMRKYQKYSSALNDTGNCGQS